MKKSKKKAQKVQLLDISPADARKRLKALSREREALEFVSSPANVVPIEVMSKLKKARLDLAAARPEKMRLSITLDVSGKTTLDGFYFDQKDQFFDRDMQFKVVSVEGCASLKKHELSDLADSIYVILCTAGIMGQAEVNIINEVNALKEQIRTVAKAFDINEIDLTHALED